MLSALDPERPFSVLSFPEELTRHSLLQIREEERARVCEFVRYKQIQRVIEVKVKVGTKNNVVKILCSTESF